MNKKGDLTKERIEKILADFSIKGSILHFSPLGHGHIHDTYLVEVGQDKEIKKYTLQRLNTRVFQQPELMMANWEKVTHHIRLKLLEIEGEKASRHCLQPIPSSTGRCYCRTPEGEYFRIYYYVDGCHTKETVSTADEAFEAGRAFGRFQKLIADLPPHEMHETIPYFHHTPRRFKRFLEASEKASQERKAQAFELISLAFQFEPLVSLVVDGLDTGRLPLRVTHNDTKIDNVLFDNETGQGLCVIDLDTTMPGSPLYDFGDLVRTATCPAPEDETDLSRVVMDLNFFQAVAEGYLSETADLLVRAEKELLIQAGLLLTFTIGLRFLTDYLEGDIYFKIKYPEHNLHRAKTQFKLLQSMQQQQKDMERILNNLLKI